MAKLVTIYGGSGFVGRYIALRMAREGWRVRVATRRPNETMFVRTFGVAGQVEPVLCNVRNDASIREAIKGADAVVNCVGVLNENGKNSFQAIHQNGTQRIAQIATEENVDRLVHFSSIGADSESESDYARSKALGEEEVLAAYPAAVILRPSVVFGTEDEFFNKFAKMTRFGPALGLVGAETRFQPVYVDNVAEAAAKGALGSVSSGVYQLGGPEIKTLRELMELMLETIGRRRLIVNLPFWAGSLIGGGFDLMQAMSLGLINNSILTRDQVQNLRTDKVVTKDARTLADMGITPVPMDGILAEYLWPYRPSGQFAAIKDSAANLKA